MFFIFVFHFSDFFFVFCPHLGLWEALGEPWRLWGKLWEAVGSCGRALGEPWEAPVELWKALGDLWGIWVSSGELWESSGELWESSGSWGAYVLGDETFGLCARLCAGVGDFWALYPNGRVREKSL